MARNVVNDGLPAVVVRDVSKTFRRPEEQRRTLKERALHPQRKMTFHEHRVLEGINFAVGRGEFFGIVGRNGCGKSTLLKCLAGIYNADGDIWCRGRLSTFIELGVGFNVDLPAFDNVVLNGIMMGLSPKEARARYERVIEFAELEEFQDLKLKNYSSGMNVRLAFSVAIQVDADILLVDEVLAVGDAAFQQKCFDVFNDLREAGKTIVFVTHDMAAMERFCDRALLLEQGKMVSLGAPQEVAERYLEINFGRDPAAVGTIGEHGGDGQARVVEVWIADSEGRRLSAAPQGQPLALKVRVQFSQSVENPQISVDVEDDEHTKVFVASTLSSGQELTGRFHAGEEATFSFGFDNVLAAGRYSPRVRVAHHGTGLDVMDTVDGASFIVSATRERVGLVDLPVAVSVDRDPVPADHPVGA